MDNAKIFSEIIEYVQENDEISYYNVMTYATKNKPEWIEWSKKRSNKIMLSEFLKSKKRTEGRAYIDRTDVAISRYIDAMIEREK